MMRISGLILLGGCVVQGHPPPGPSPFADLVLEAPGHTGMGHHNAELAVNGVRGGGWSRGSLDVFSLVVDVHRDWLVLGWSGGVAVDIDGPDLVVFENPFEISGGPARFMDPVVVEVSPDGVDWVTFPHAYTADDPTKWSSHAAHWSGFAGLTPVDLHAEDNAIDPFDAAAGGDAFDLADLDPADPIARAILEHGVMAVRLSAAATWIDPNTGAPFPLGPSSDGSDIDGIAAARIWPTNSRRPRVNR